MVWISNGYEYEIINIPESVVGEVCIECLVFNQKDYICDALDGFLMQNTNFRFYVLIIDDCSDDGTQNLLREYAEKYPDKILVLIAKENIFRKKENRDVYDEIRKTFAAKAKYVATCEGDDYWIDPDKLQIQYDYMENHQKCMMCLHNSWWVDCVSGERKKANPFEVEGEGNLDVKEIVLMKNGYPATASRFYRSVLLHKPDFVKYCPIGDYPLALYAIAKGEVHYLNRIMCTYRFGSTGSTTIMQREQQSYLLYHHLGLFLFLIAYDKYTNYLYHRWISIWERKMICDACDRMEATLKLSDLWNIYGGGYYLRYQKFLPIADICQAQLYDENYLSDYVRYYLNKYKYIIIMGTGVYSRMLTKQLLNNGIEISGYVKSFVGIDEKKHGDYPLWSFYDIPYKTKDFCVVVGILPKENDMICESLKRAGISNYIEPFLFEDIRIYIQDLKEL